MIEFTEKVYLKIRGNMNKIKEQILENRNILYILTLIILPMITIGITLLLMQSYTLLDKIILGSIIGAITLWFSFTIINLMETILYSHAF